MKPLFIHGAVLVVSAGLAYSVWNKDEPLPEKQQSMVDVWGGNQASFSKLSFEGKTRKVRLEAQKDATGYYYVGTVDVEEAAPPPSPHGAPSATPLKPPAPKTSRFVSVKAGETLVKALAPLKALRAVGKIGPERYEEFGLDKPEGTLKVTVDGKEQVLLLGGTAPGGSDRYAKYQNNGEVFAISGDIAQSLLFGDSRLPERDPHGFKNDDVVRVRVQKGAKSRELVRVKEKNDGWGDVATPSKQDETAGNWMTKLGRLRGSEFVEKPASPLRPEDAIVRVDYFENGQKALGFVELYKVPGEKGSDYLIRTEWDRWYVKVTSTNGEQVETDLASVLK
ncbi:MAG TPA: DUF4340 domain-containing protein [Polyangiaceae bacterium]|nr:DUF4340 domain-containing protein [Polyangiaceae bacterium]